MSVTRTDWTIVTDPAALAKAEKLARGSYQLLILQGAHNLSGSTLKGKARQYSGRYAASRDTLLMRLREAGIPFGEERAEHGARLLRIGPKAGL